MELKGMNMRCCNHIVNDFCFIRAGVQLFDPNNDPRLDIIKAYRSRENKDQPLVIFCAQYNISHDDFSWVYDEVNK